MYEQIEMFPNEEEPMQMCGFYFNEDMVLMWYEDGEWMTHDEWLEKQ